MMTEIILKADETTNYDVKESSVKVLAEKVATMNIKRSDFYEQIFNENTFKEIQQQFEDNRWYDYKVMQVSDLLQQIKRLISKTIHEPTAPTLAQGIKHPLSQFQIACVTTSNVLNTRTRSDGRWYEIRYDGGHLLHSSLLSVLILSL